MLIDVKAEVFPLKKVFTISRGSRSFAEVVTVKITKDGFSGFGECVPYQRYNETVQSVINQINTVNDFSKLIEIDKHLPAGAARNALDCAFWDWQAKIKSTTVAQLTNINIAPVTTSFTLSLDTAERMSEEARNNSHLPVLKIKLGGGEEDLNRISLIRKAAPEAKIIIDANEGWSLEDYKKLIPHFVNAEIKMIEQPFASSKDDYLMNVERPIPICADESCHDSSDLEKCIGKYDVINIKLDKTGGLTEALKLKEKAKTKNFDIMVGCMVGTSLAMAPALILAQNVKWVDLDGPLLMSEDRKHNLIYKNSEIQPASTELWG